MYMCLWSSYFLCWVEDRIMYMCLWSTSCGGWRTGSCSYMCLWSTSCGGWRTGSCSYMCLWSTSCAGWRTGSCSYMMQTFLLRDHARYYAQTVNILKFRKFFVHFKSYLLKFRRQYELLCCLLAKIRAFLRNWRVPYGKCPPLAVSLSQHHALFAIKSTKRCGT